MRVRVFRHVFRPEPPQEFEVQSLGEWLLSHYGAKMPRGLQVFAGEPSVDTEITADVAAIASAQGPQYTVLESPGIVGYPIASAIIMMAVSAAIQSIMAKPVPISNRGQDSPNNQLSARQNQIRTMQRVEDIFGTVKAIPSVLMQTYTKYVQNQQVETGYYCIGRGYYDIAQIQEGDTVLSDIIGASAAVYAPFTSPNSGDAPQLLVGSPIIDKIVTVRRSSSVSGITLKPANQLQLAAASSYLFRGPGAANGVIPLTTVDVIAQPQLTRKPNFAAVCQISQVLTISMANTLQTRALPGGATVSVSAATKTYTSSLAQTFRGVVDGTTVTVAGGFGSGVNTGVKTIVSHTDTTLTVAEALADESSVGAASFAINVNYSGTRTIATVGDGYVTLTGGSVYTTAFTETFVATVTVANGLVDWSDWFTVPELDRTEVWTNVIAEQGMYKDDGAKSQASVDYEVQMEKLTSLFAPTGVVETMTGNITGTTSNLCAETLERVTGWVGPARVRMRRTTPFDFDFNGLVADEIKWQDLYGVSPITKTDFGNKTTIHTVTLATISSTASSTRELNCIASRRIPTYNGASFSGAFDATGRLASGTISASSRIVDILAAVTVDPKIGNRPITDLDLTQVWATQAALDSWNTECGQFNYTFDSDQVSYENTLTTIAAAAFCIPYRQNGVIRLALDRPQSVSTALFSHRNKKPKAETITRKFASDSDYDGVELVYQDPDTLSSETIRLPLDGSYTKLKKVEVPGIRSYTQAWFRANREYQHLTAQRLSIETDVTTDARALLPNSRVDIVDNTRFKSFDGEVVGQSGMVLTLSTAVEFTPGASHSVILQRRDGSIQSITCYAGTSANQVVLASLPTEAIVTQPDPDAGIRTSFSFAADSARGAQAWLVQTIGITDGQYMKLSAINYSDDYYAADSAPIPDKSGVIN